PDERLRGARPPAPPAGPPRVTLPAASPVVAAGQAGSRICLLVADGTGRGSGLSPPPGSVPYRRSSPTGLMPAAQPAAVGASGPAVDHPPACSARTVISYAT